MTIWSRGHGTSRTSRSQLQARTRALLQMAPAPPLGQKQPVLPFYTHDSGRNRLGIRPRPAWLACTPPDIHVHRAAVSKSKLCNVLGLQPRLRCDSVAAIHRGSPGLAGCRLSAFLSPRQPACGSCQGSPLQGHLLDPAQISECEVTKCLCCWRHPAETPSQQGPGAGTWSRSLDRGG